MLTILGFFRNPVISVKALNEILEEYGAVSGYKVNEEKSIILSTDVSPQVKYEIGLINNALWQDKVRDLGICLPKNNKGYVMDNIVLLMKLMKAQFNRWWILNLSWFGTIAAVNMSIMPKWISCI